VDAQLFPTCNTPSLDTNDVSRIIVKYLNCPPLPPARECFVFLVARIVFILPEWESCFSAFHVLCCTKELGLPPVSQTLPSLWLIESSVSHVYFGFFQTLIVTPVFLGTYFGPQPALFGALNGVPFSFFPPPPWEMMLLQSSRVFANGYYTAVLERETFFATRFD